MLDEGTDQAKLTFGDLKVGEHFIFFPGPGDNHGHGGYLGAHNVFEKTERRASGELVPVNSGSGVDDRGVVSHFPDTMPVLKVSAGPNRKSMEEWMKAADEERDRADGYQAAYNLLKDDVEGFLFNLGLRTERLGKGLEESKARVEKSKEARAK